MLAIPFVQAVHISVTNTPFDISKHSIRANEYAQFKDSHYTITHHQANASTATITRKELRDMSTHELDTYKHAVRQLQSHGIIDDLAILHTACETYAHNHARFLPWHRAFLLYYEHIMHVVTGLHIHVPYWDWSIDAHAPHSSHVLTTIWLASDSHCFTVNYPHTHCVRRAHFIDAFYGTAHVMRMLRLPFSTFHHTFEVVPHAIVHMNVGGRDGDMAMLHSCNDPVFFHHHSYCDYLWAVQQQKGQGEYTGDRDERLFPFDVRVRDVWHSNVHYKPYRIDYAGGTTDVKMKVKDVDVDVKMNVDVDRKKRDVKMDRDTGRKMKDVKMDGDTGRDVGRKRSKRNVDKKVNVDKKANKDVNRDGRNKEVKKKDKHTGRHVRSVSDYYIDRHRYSKRKVRRAERMVNGRMSILDRLLL